MATNQELENPTAPPSPRTELKRQALRGQYDRPTVEAVLDDGFICHVACAVDGQAYLIPMVYARIGGELVIHGSTGNRVLRALADGAEATISVMHCDGLIVARSAFHNSVNYRSVTIYGPVRELEGPEKGKALDAIVDIVAPGRAADCRPPNEAELRRTLVLAIPLGEASAKLRLGGPVEEDGDWELPYWAGVIPLATTRGTPVPCERLAQGTRLPEYLDREGEPARLR